MNEFSYIFRDASVIIEGDIVEAVQEFFISGQLLKQVNFTTLTLIPIKARPVTVADFRPIACCNVLYKIISKVLCNRLAKVLPTIGDRTSIKVLLRAFATLSCSSGLEMNTDKSDIYFNGMEQGEIDYILSISGFKPGVFPFRYLGVPISHKRMGIGDCTRLIEKVVARIRSWGAKKLSYAGRLVLIKAVLSQLHSYWTRIFVIPLTVIDRIEGICRNYLWSGSDQYVKTPSVKWDNI
ncbi:uncharacterized protein LOC141651616 [Silene latifolia]|uniref:uncharacterized protein LOC141651616 n=1 Tax=Silene latifolia TaxID=37657 RepID=UPI003D776947